MVTKSVSKNADIRKGLSKKEAYLLTSLAEKKKRLFGLKDVMDELGCSYNYAKVIASRLAKKKWLIPIEKGRYLIVPLEAGKESIYTEHEFIIASKLVQPYYIGYWSAMNYHGMTEQVPFTVFVATIKRRNKKEIHGVKYEFITLTKNKFFGFSAVNIAGEAVSISDMEKTIIDTLDHPEYCGGISEAAKALWSARQKIDFGKLVNYAEKMKNGAIFKRLGYLLQKLEIKIPDELNKKIKENISKGYAALDTVVKRKGKHNSEWRLLVNVSDKDLLEWREIH